MMLKALILYGSQARNEGIHSSDVDLLGVSDSGLIQKPIETHGVSLHVYPFGWLRDQASQGSLFVYHILHEGVVLYDSCDVISEVLACLQLKPNYADEIQTASLVAAMILARGDEGFALVRKRYFWAIRTILMSASANAGKPIFASDQLEKFSGIHGISVHINNRRDEPYRACRRFGKLVLERYSPVLPNLEGDLEDALLREGGIAIDTLDRLGIVDKGDHGFPEYI